MEGRDLQLHLSFVCRIKCTKNDGNCIFFYQTKHRTSIKALVNSTKITCMLFFMFEIDCLSAFKSWPYLQVMIAHDKESLTHTIVCNRAPSQQQKGTLQTQMNGWINEILFNQAKASPTPARLRLDRRARIQFQDVLNVSIHASSAQLGLRSRTLPY